MRIDGGTLHLSGPLLAPAVARLWDPALEAARGGAVREIDCADMGECDGAGVALLFEIERLSGVRAKGLAKGPSGFLPPFTGKPFDYESASGLSKESAIAALGRVGAAFGSDVVEQIHFTGQMASLLAASILRPHTIRWKDTWVIFEKAGVNALLIVGMIGFLMGLIMAFQSAVPLRTFGVDIFVVNLVALAVTRELGPIMTAVVLAGRSGSAFAAEIGTMKVNEEVNALTTMGLDPVRFLVLPRVLAGVAVTPLLTLFADLLGVLGGMGVMMSFGYPWVALFNQLSGAVTIRDLMAGLIKSVVFGLLVAGIGCLRGLQTKAGPTAVGDSTTRAVVSGIFLVVVTDAIFSALFYSIGF